jgi:hypothetical protein
MPVRPDARTRGLVARVALITCLVFAGWAALLAATGGFETSLLGFRIRTHNVVRPLQAAALAFLVFVWARGIRALRDAAAAGVRATDARLARWRLPYGAVAVASSAAVLVAGIRWATGVAGGSDSYGYISQADLWLEGLPIVPQPWTADVPWPDADWTFSPLGYRPALGAPGTIVASYAVGLPLLMAAVKSVAGHAAVFWLAPIAGACLVFVSYGVGRWLDSRAAGAIAAFLVATSATLLSEVSAPMSDVVAAAGLSASCWLLLRAPGRLPIVPGLCAALACAVRPNLAPTLLVLACWVALRPRVPAMGFLRRILHVAVYLAAAAPGLLIPAWANWRLFGSPLLSGYGTVETIYQWSNVSTNLVRYPALLIEARTPAALLGFAALLIPLKRLWPRLADRPVLFGIALFVFSVVAQYVAYEPATGGGYLRFLLPCWPFVMTAAARVLLMVGRPGLRAAVVVAFLAAQGLASFEWACKDGRCTNLSERKYTGIASLVRSRTEPGSVVYAFQHSGSVRYYGGRMTLRYDQLDPKWLDRSVDWFAARGVHAYAVLDDWELEVFRTRFAGQHRVQQIDDPAATYRGEVVTHFFDLLAPRDPGRATEVLIDRFDGPRYPPPVPPPDFRLSDRSP